MYSVQYIPNTFSEPHKCYNRVRGGDVELKRFALSICSGTLYRDRDTQQGLGMKGRTWEENVRLEVVRSHWHRGRWATNERINWVKETIKPRIKGILEARGLGLSKSVMEGRLGGSVG